jgi:hypothetical protein
MGEPSSKPSKFYDLFSKIDPYKEFVVKASPRALLALRAAALSIASCTFLVYLAFAVLSYVNTPLPSELSVERIVPSDPPKALFQFSIALPVDFTTCDPLFPTKYTTPFSKTLVPKQVSPYRAASAIPAELQIPDNTFTYEVYTFPVYGTIDEKTSSSTLLYFEPCKYSNSVNFPLMFFVGAASSPKAEKLQVSPASFDF